jgi:hypothetical protein
MRPGSTKLGSNPHFVSAEPARTAGNRVRSVKVRVLPVFSGPQAVPGDPAGFHKIGFESSFRIREPARTAGNRVRSVKMHLLPATSEPQGSGRVHKIWVRIRIPNRKPAETQNWVRSVKAGKSDPRAGGQ